MMGQLVEAFAAFVGLLRLNRAGFRDAPRASRRLLLYGAEDGFGEQCVAERLVALAGEAGVARNADVYAILVGLFGPSLVQPGGAFFGVGIRRFEGVPRWTGLAHAVAVPLLWFRKIRCRMFIIRMFSWKLNGFGASLEPHVGQKDA